MAIVSVLLDSAPCLCQEEDVKIPLAKLTKIASEGNPSAQFQVGMNYLKGRMGVEKDPVEAIYWFSQAAKQDSPKAQYNLGLCYEKGLGVEKDMDYALVLFRSAADLGLEAAQLRTGLELHKRKKNDEAVKYIRLAAKQGHVEAQREYGRFLLYGIGIKPAPAEGIKILKRIAEKGDNMAKVLLAESCTGSIPGTYANLEKMIEYLWEGASQDFAEAQTKLGYCYEEGIGVNKDTDLAVKWYRKAATQNYPRALVNLGHCYAKGKGTAMDGKTAFKLYNKAAKLGFPPGLTNVGVCYANGIGNEMDEFKAKNNLIKAAELGDSNAMYSLGILYEHGLGDIAPNRSKALDWYHKSAEKKDPRALKAITFLNLQAANTLEDEKMNKKNSATMQNTQLSEPIESLWSIQESEF